MERKSNDFDVIIIGSGPAGMFAGLELSKLCPNKKIAIFEKGPYRLERTEDNLTSGWGGAGTFSDGKLTLPNLKFPQSLSVGGHLVSMIGKWKFLKLIEYVNQIYTDFGGRSEIYEKNEEKIQELVERASRCDLRIIPTRIRHFGSDLVPKIAKSIKEELQQRGVEIFLETPVKSIQKSSNKFLVKIENGDLYKSKYLLAAPGREGADWLVRQAEILGLEIQPRQTSVDIGVRVEVQNHILRPLTDYLSDPKIEYYSKLFKDKVRTFCVCKNGQVVVEKYRGLLTTVNGHSLYEKPLSGNTNFAILVSVNFTKPFKDPLEFAKSISENANRLAGKGKVLVQRLGDLRDGRRSTDEKIAEGFVEPTLKEATPGDIGFVIPYRFMFSILGMLKALDKIAPGLNGDHTLLYAAEVKFYSSRIKTSPELETVLPGLFVAGDGAGISRGLVQSSASGIIAAQALAKRLKK